MRVHRGDAGVVRVLVHGVDPVVVFVVAVSAMSSAWSLPMDMVIVLLGASDAEFRGVQKVEFVIELLRWSALRTQSCCWCRASLSIRSVRVVILLCSLSLKMLLGA